MEDLSTFTPKNLLIPTRALEELISIQTNKTVGKVLKRFEISDDKMVIKSQVKEILYEEMRNFRDMLIALNYGIEVQKYEFKSRETK
jgi:hypothetical protein